ncbi:MAG TPA: serine/threonine-protein kinase [Kofleriaceae bacterium]
MPDDAETLTMSDGARAGTYDDPLATRSASPSSIVAPGAASAARRSAATQLRDPARYDVIGEHGRGGLGRVSRAHDRDLGRDVAIKELISRDHVSELRFVRESLITARLEHPGIVPVYEAGRWPDGTPFYAMKLVAGRSLRELIAERTTVEDRIALLHHVIAVADAIAYAHGRNIIHRDLKPANVIIGDFGETIVIDWGLAKDLTTPDDAGAGGGVGAQRDAELTSAGSVLGTPAYMAPEQRRGEQVDQRADVFAIGAMLWELCALQKQPEADSQLRRRILDAAGIDQDLVTIIDKALAPDPAQRYRDAGALAADLKAFKSGARITARSYSLLAMLGHWTRRHRRLALSALAAAVLLVAGVAALAVLYRSSSHNAAAARERLVQSYLEQGRRLLLDGEYLRALPYLSEAYTEGDRSTAVQVLLARAERFAGLQLGVHVHAARARAAAFRPDGRHILSVSDDGEAVIWDASTGRVDAAMPRPPPPPPRPGLETMYYSRISRDGGFVAVPLPGGVTLWDGVHTRSIGPPGAERLGIDTGGARLAVTVGGELSAWRVATGERLWTASIGVAMLHVAWSGDVVVALCADKIVRVVDGGSVVRLAARGRVDKISVGANGGIATVSGMVVELWDPSGARRGELESRSAVTAASFSPDTGRIAVAGDNGVIGLHDASTGAALGELVGHRGGVSSIEFSADGARLATAGYDLTVRIWDAADHRPILSLRGPRDLPIVIALRIDDAGKRVLIPTADGAVYAFGTADPDIELGVETGDTIRSAEFLADGQRFATFGAHALGVWSVATGRQLDHVDAPGAMLVTISPDAAKLAILDGDTAHIEIRNRASGAQMARLTCAGHFWQVTFDHASERVVTGCDDLVELWNLRGERLARLAGHQGLIGATAFSPDDRRVISGSNDHTFRIWDLASGREIGQATTSGSPGSVAFDVTGTRIVTGTSDRIARVWDAATLQPLRGFEHASAVEGAALSADGSLVAAATRDGIVGLWDATTSALLAELHHPLRALSVAFSPDGTHLLSTGEAPRAIVSRIERETRSPEVVAAFVRCHAPYRLKDTRLESATPVCDPR